MYLPNKKTIKVKIDHDKDTFVITDIKGNLLPEFENIGSIILHDVIYDEVGVFCGVYLKPKHLQYYEENVDKTKYPRYIDWCLGDKDSGDILEKSTFKDEDYEKTYKASIDEKQTIRVCEDGKFKNGFDEFIKTYKRAFLIIRKPYNTDLSIATISIY